MNTNVKNLLKVTKNDVEDISLRSNISLGCEHLTQGNNIVINCDSSTENFASLYSFTYDSSKNIIFDVSSWNYGSDKNTNFYAKECSLIIKFNANENFNNVKNHFSIKDNDGTIDKSIAPTDIAWAKDPSFLAGDIWKFIVIFINDKGTRKCSIIPVNVIKGN